VLLELECLVSFFRGVDEERGSEAANRGNLARFLGCNTFDLLFQVSSDKLNFVNQAILHNGFIDDLELLKAKLVSAQRNRCMLAR